MVWPAVTARIGLAVGLYLAAFTILASVTFLAGTGLWDDFDLPLWQFWSYAFTYPDEPVVRSWLITSSIPAAVIPLAIGGAIAYQQRYNPSWKRPGRMAAMAATAPSRLLFSPKYPRPVARGASDNLGHSDWRDPASTRQLFPPVGHPVWGGIAVAEAYRVDLDPALAGVPFDPNDSETWGQGGKRPLLLDDATKGSGHSTIFGGSGTGKTASAVVTALTWTGSSVILDPSTEMGPMLSRALRRQKKKVVHIGVPDPGSPLRNSGMNVLSFIDITRPDSELHVRSVVSWIYDEAAANAAGKAARAEDPFFANMGRALVTCLLAHLLWSDSDEVEISLATLAAAFVPEREMVDLLRGIHANSPSPLARRIASSLMQCSAEETWAGVY
jgi:type IV secretion system protein VirD4